MRPTLLFGVGALSVSALFAACSCPGTPCSPPLAGIDAGVFVENSPAVVQFTQPLPYGCEDVKAESVSAELVDEANLSVPATATFSQPATSQQIDVAVSFQARAAGWYHLNTLIEPGLSVVQGEVLVARDRGATPAVNVSATCREAHLTTVGTAVCDGLAFRNFGAPAVDAPFAAKVADVRGDIIWSWSAASQKLERWHDSAALLAHEPAAGLTQLEQPQLLVSSEDGGEAFLATSAEVVRVGYRNGALVQLARNPLGTVLDASFGYATSTALYLFEVPSQASVTSTVRACGYDLANDQLTKRASCQTLVGIPLGVVDGVLWLRDETSVRAYTVASSGDLKLSQTLRLPTIGLRSVTSALPSAPVFQVVPGGEWIAARSLPQGPVFDLYRHSANVTSANGSATAVFLVDSTGTRIFAR